jgi:hypothetical protein
MLSDILDHHHKPAGMIARAGPALSADALRLHDRVRRASDARGMTGDEMGETLRQIGWPTAELARRLSVREDTVRGWLKGRRPVPPNLERWLLAVRDNLANAPALPDGWQR